MEDETVHCHCEQLCTVRGKIYLSFLFNSLVWGVWELKGENKISCTLEKKSSSFSSSFPFHSLCLPLVTPELTAHTTISVDPDVLGQGAPGVGEQLSSEELKGALGDSSRVSARKGEHWERKGHSRQGRDDLNIPHQTLQFRKAMAVANIFWGCSLLPGNN